MAYQSIPGTEDDELELKIIDDKRHKNRMTQYRSIDNNKAERHPHKYPAVDYDGAQRKARLKEARLRQKEYLSHQQLD